MDTSPRVTAGPPAWIAPWGSRDRSGARHGYLVHDVGDYKVGDEWRVLESGMCLTVEPGIADYWARLGARPGFKAAKRAQKIERQNCSVMTAPA